MEQALSEAASSLSSFTPRPGPQRPWMIQIKVIIAINFYNFYNFKENSLLYLQIWLLLADVYLNIEQPAEALNCIHEASSIYPLSHQIMYMVRKTSILI